MIRNMTDVRREYGGLDLNVKGSEQDPYLLFNRWLDEIVKTDNYDPTAMLLSTIDFDGRPDSRVVLLKGIEQESFLFYTNYNSSKAIQIDSNPNVSLNFFWPYMARQINIKGIASKLTAKQNDDYFYSRPRLSQIAAIASKQSEILKDRMELEEQMNLLIEKYEQEPIIRPENWGGFAVKPNEIEFWQGRDNRLHDRLIYKKLAEKWQICRLAP